MTKFFELKSKIKINSGLKLILLECLCFALGFYLASVRFLFGIYPFGISLVCVGRRYTLFTFCGAVLSCIFTLNFNLPYIITLCCVLALRIICSLIQKKDKHSSVILGKVAQGSVLDTLFYENSSVRVVICGFCTLALGIYFFIVGGFSFFDGFVALFFALFSSIFTFATLGIFDDTSKKGLLLGICAISFAILYGIRAFEIWGLSPCIILSCAIVLYVSKHHGLTSSTAYGLLLGLCTGAIYAPAIALLGLVSGFIWKSSSYIAIMSAFVLSSAYAIFANGYEAIVYLIPEMLFSCLIMYSLLRFELLPTPAFLKSPSENSTNLILKEQKKRANELISQASSALFDVSSMLKDVSQKSKRLSRDELLSLCYECTEAQCYSCPKQSICWEKDNDFTQDTLKALSTTAFSNGSVCSTDVSEKFLHRCPNIDTIFEQINSKIKQNRTQGAKNDKLETCFSDLELCSKMLTSVKDEAFCESELDFVATSKLKRVCARLGFACSELCVYGSKNRKIIAFDVDTQKTKCTATAIKEGFEKALGARLTEPSFNISDTTTMTILSACSIVPKAFTMSKPANEGAVNGDTCVSFYGTDSKYYTILCDGMGSGSEARLTSMLCSGFLQKLLSRGTQKDHALLLLNNFIRARGKESSCTVDMLELDMVSGSGKLIKSGACASFIKRGESVFKLESKTMPIGIIKGIDAQILSFESRPGDVCIMLSDGVVCDENDANAITKIIKSAPTGLDSKSLCEKILSEAKSRHQYSDDMTVCVVEIGA